MDIGTTDRYILGLMRSLIPFIVLVLLLGLTEYGVRQAIPTYQAQLEEDYLLPRKLTLHSLNVWLDYISKPSTSDNRLRVLAIGDSTFRTGDGSLGFSLRDNIARSTHKPIQFYNLAKGGLHIPEKFLLLEKLSGNTDIIYMNLLYSPEEIGNVAADVREDFPTLASRPWTALDSTLLSGKLPSKAQQQKAIEEAPPTLPIEMRLNRILASYWKFYHYHPLISINLFGNAPQQWLKSLVNREKGVAYTLSETGTRIFAMLLGQATFPLPYDVTDLPYLTGISDVEALPKKQRSSLLWNGKLQAMPKLELDNPTINMLWLQKIAHLARNHPQTKYVIFMSRFNTDIIKHYQLLDWDVYQHNMQVLRSILKADNILFLDYNQPQYHWEMNRFIDLVHTPGKASEDLAKHLYDDSYAFIKGEL